MNDALGNRMKQQYENRTRIFLPRRTYCLIRLDGKAFHTFTAKLKKPFDDDLIFAMNETARQLCEGIQGAKFAYVQSDEISILLTDFEKITTEAWFDNNVQKMVSISASMASAFFNQIRQKQGYNETPAIFDSRVFTIPDPIEVANYFIWRQQDASRNSVSMVAQSLYPHNFLMKKSSAEMQELIFQKGINWNDYDARKKRGGFIERETYLNNEVERSRWAIVEPPIFTQQPDFLYSRIPQIVFPTDGTPAT